MFCLAEVWDCCVLLWLSGSGVGDHQSSEFIIVVWISMAIARNIYTSTSLEKKKILNIDNTYKANITAVSVITNFCVIAGF